MFNCLFLNFWHKIIEQNIGCCRWKCSDDCTAWPGYSRLKALSTCPQTQPWGTAWSLFQSATTLLVKKYFLMTCLNSPGAVLNHSHTCCHWIPGRRDQHLSLQSPPRDPPSFLSPPQHTRPEPLSACHRTLPSPFAALLPSPGHVWAELSLAKQISQAFVLNAQLEVQVSSVNKDYSTRKPCQEVTTVIALKQIHAYVHLQDRVPTTSKLFLTYIPFIMIKVRFFHQSLVKWTDACIINYRNALWASIILWKEITKQRVLIHP